MKTNSYIILLGLLLTSCLNDFEPNTSSFNKVYGNNLDANLVGILATKDNGFLLYGSMDKSIQSAPGSTGDLATIIKTDAMGNEMWRKSIGLGDVSFDNNPYLIGIRSEISKITNIGNVIELQNGDFFIVAEFILPGFGFDALLPGYIVLNSIGKVLEYNTLLDNMVDPGYQLQNQVMYRFLPLAFNIPGSSDIIILLRSRLLDNNFNDDTNDFYSLYRLKENDYQNPVWVLDNMTYLTDEQIPQGLSFDSNGDIVVIGYGTVNGQGQCFRTFISKVNPDGTVGLEDVLTPPDELHMAGSVIPYKTGYVIQELRNPPNQKCRWQGFNVTDSDDIGGLRLVSKDLASDTLIYSTLPEMSNYNLFLLLETFDNGIVFGFGLSGQAHNGTYISKMDASGQLIWEFRDPFAHIRRGITQTPDGGIVFGATRFGSTKKWSLTKLTKDGKL